MHRLYIYHILSVLIAGVWFVFGLYAKVLGQVPRHEQIVSEILGSEHAPILTRAIGWGEIFIGIWILTGRFPHLCASLQITLVLVMNLIEIFSAKDLLMWGPLNLLFALLFAIVVGVHTFVLRPKPETD